jgi:hypothetical protein
MHLVIDMKHSCVMLGCVHMASCTHASLLSPPMRQWRPRHAGVCSYGIMHSRLPSLSTHAAVVAKKGALVAWDSRIIHSTSRPRKGRPLARPRFVVYGGLVPRCHLTETDLDQRWERLREVRVSMDRES